MVACFVYFSNYEIKDDLLTRSFEDYPENVRYAYEVMQDFSLKLEKDHQFSVSGFHAEKQEGKIDLLKLDVTVPHPATLEEARALELILTKQLIETLNRNETLKPYFIEFPVSTQSISLSLSFRHPENIFCNSYIDYVHTSPKSRIPENRNKIFYYTHRNEFKGDSKFDETYEEAELKNKSSFPINPYIHQSTNLEKLIESLDYSFTRNIKKKYNLYEESLGIENLDKLEEITGKFTCLSPTNQEEARYLLVSAAEMLLDELNQNELIRPLLSEYPITAKSLQFKIDFRKNKIFDGNSSFDQGVNCVTLENSEVTYFITDPNAPSSDIVIRENYIESLQEAKGHSISILKRFKLKIYSFFSITFYVILSFFSLLFFNLIALFT